MTNDRLVKLFEHNNWANDRIDAACAALSDAQLDASPGSATLGTIRETLLHLASAQRGYLSLLTLPVDARPTTPLAYAEVPASLAATGAGLLGLAADAEGTFPTSRIRTRDGYLVEPWVVMLQVINHATEHREQIKSMLTAMGVTPPEIDGWSYGEAAEALEAAPE